MPYRERHGAEIFYETWGEVQGPWVMLVNGHTRSATDFRLFARFLTERGYRVLAFDNRGAGKTESEPDFSIDDIVEDARALLSEVGAEHTHLLGISFGGAVSMTFARRFPQMTRSLVLVSTASYFAHAQLAKRPPMTEYFSPRFAQVNPLLYRTLTKETDNAFADKRREEGTRAQARAIARFDARKWVSEIEVPTLIVHGEDDRIIPPEAARFLSEHIAGARLELVTGAGHLLLAEAPRKLYDVAEKFFREHQ
jgi:pimeloyl-ACP methyl ester carboxylesterase